MSKELFVSSTPHETKVGLVEDDLLAEIYLELENEYTLAGSIYKGRVTRVLPGMQSAFVDIGLERDAFLYVSDFMELEDADEMDEMPGTPGSEPQPRQEQPRHERPRSEQRSSEHRSQPRERVESQSDPALAAAEGLPEASEGESAEGARPAGNRDAGAGEREGRAGFGRGRRRRGRRGERMPESKFAKPAGEPGGEIAPRAERSERSDRTDRSDRAERSDRADRPDRSQRSDRFERPDRTDRSEYGPPPGYQPILLPGESISKYQRLAQSQSGSRPAARPVSDPNRESSSAPIARTFPEDEPMFAQPQVENLSAATVEPGEEISGNRADAGISFRADDRQNFDRQNFNRQNVDRESPDRQTFDRPEAVDQQKFGHHGADHQSVERNHFEQMNVASVFGGNATETPEADLKEADARQESQLKQGTVSDPLSDPLSDPMSDPMSGAAQAYAAAATITGPAGTMAEEEIEEEEADLAHYADALEEDGGFEELEEEVRAAGEPHQDHDGEIAAVAESLTESGELAADELIKPFPAEADEEAEEPDAAEIELDEAQAQAEAILAAEAGGGAMIEARAEVRAPAETAAYTQRAPRPGFDRKGGGQRGRRGGRRFPRREPQNVPLISDLLKEGQEILVQIAKEPIGKKGARITSHIALPGRFLVYMPTVNHTGVSRKISSDEERQRLKRIIQSERENGHGGFIVRTAAQGAAEEELRADIRFLKGLWAEIKTRADNGKGPTLIYHDLNVVERVLRDQVTSDFNAIWVDNEQEYERILRFATRFQPALVKRVKLYTKEIPLFEQFGLTEEINKALKSKVWLKSGGYIVINQTEALVAIDVNTGKYVGKTARLEDTIVKTNVDAIKEIVRQVRLRDLGGIIIIDFIDMDERRNRQKVMQALEEALRSDRAPSKVLQFNDFGLVAITRKRVKQSLERTIGSPCPYCESTGFVKSVTTVCNEIYLEMRKLSKHLEHPDVMLRVNPEVGKALKANNGRALTEMEELTKKTVIVKSDPALHQEQFDIH